MVKISASLLAANPLNLQAEVESALEAGSDWLHLDIMDQHYVPNLSFGTHICQALRDKFPQATLDVHLMVSKVDEVVNNFADAGADIITIHPSATTHLHRSLQNIKDKNIKAGVCFNPAESLSSLDYCQDMIDLVLLMSVNPGYGGQKNIPAMVNKTAQLKAKLSHWQDKPLIELDGGISVANAAEYISAGADVLVMGSALFKQTDRSSYIAAIKSFKID